TLNVLEEYLAGFRGCVIIVSHDRYFMDKVVDHIFEYKGDGFIKDFPGNYTQLREREDMLQEQEIIQIRNKSRQEVKPKDEIDEKRAKKSGLTFTEKQEFNKLLAEIEGLEKEKSQIESDLSKGTLSSDDLLTKSKRHGDIMKVLDVKELRWLELNEKND
ncbi:MAG TPA: ABC transporter, partial [Bacteroidales bacterium]|nr:ABC transporter [Bacteroidales bacterium]